MRDLHSARAQEDGEIDHVADALDVGTMNDNIDGERQLQLHDRMGQLAFAGKGASIASDVVGGLRIGVLDRDLDVIKPGLAQLGESPGGEANAGGDQIGVEAGEAGGGRDVDEIAPRRRLPAGEMSLQHAERSRLVKDPKPRPKVKLLLTRLERERIRAIRTSERAAVGQLRQQTDRRRENGCAVARHTKAPSTDIKVPKTKAPKIRAPKIRAPKIRAPKIRAPRASSAPGRATSQ